MSDSDERGWHARALAAERTVEVLKRKVIELYNGGGSSIQHTLDRARIREADARRRHELVAMRNAELLAYSARLEGEVAARTRDIQVILDNVVFGFLVVGADFKIRSFTRSCGELLSSARLADTPLGIALGFEPKRRIELELSLQQIFDDILPVEVTVDQLARTAVGAGGRSLRLDGRVIRAADGSVSSVLLTITDVTALDAAQRVNAHYELIVQLLRQRDAFAVFVGDFHSLAADARIAVATGDQRLARRAVHTMKGNAACFGLADLASTIHAIEGQAELDDRAIDAVEQELTTFLEANADVLDIANMTEPGRAIIGTRELEALAGAPSLAAVASWIQDLRRRPAHVMLAPFEGMVRRLAQRCEKEVILVVEGGDLRVNCEVLAPIMRELVHVVRNAIDHGIEPANQRGDKPVPAQLVIRIAETPTDYELTVEDDGRGIDVDTLIYRAIAMGVPGAMLANRSYDELVELVFVDGLTTAVTATEVSGRGVGMSTIAAAVKRANGSVHVHSVPGCGTRIEIRVPRPGTVALTPRSRSLSRVELAH